MEKNTKKTWGRQRREGKNQEERQRYDMEYGKDISFAYPSEEEGGILLVQMIYTCLRGEKRKGDEGASTL